MTFWSLTNSDFLTDQTFNQFHYLNTDLDLHRIMSGFYGAFATGVTYQQGTLTLPDTWFRPPFGTYLYSNCWDQIPRVCHVFTRLFTSNTSWYFLDFAYGTQTFQLAAKSCVVKMTLSVYNFFIYWCCNKNRNILYFQVSLLTITRAQLIWNARMPPMYVQVRSW